MNSIGNCFLDQILCERATRKDEEVGSWPPLKGTFKDLDCLTSVLPTQFLFPLPGKTRYTDTIRPHGCGYCLCLKTRPFSKAVYSPRSSLIHFGFQQMLAKTLMDVSKYSNNSFLACFHLLVFCYQCLNGV